MPASSPKSQLDLVGLGHGAGKSTLDEASQSLGGASQTFHDAACNEEIPVLWS